MEIEERLDQYADETKEWKRKKALADDLVKGMSNCLWTISIVAHFFSSGLEGETKHLRAVIKEHKEHVQCLKEGERFVPKLTGKKAEREAAAKQRGKKRKNGRSGKGGSFKRMRSEGVDTDGDVEMDSDGSMSDFIVEDDESDDGSDSDKDSDAGSDDSDKDSDDDGNKSDGDAKSNDSDAEDDEEVEVTQEQLEAMYVFLLARFYASLILFQHQGEDRRADRQAR